MKLRSKIVLLAVVPLLLACIVLSLSIYRHGMTLLAQEKALVESSWMANKEAELMHYVRLAQSALQPLLEQADQHPEHTAHWQAEALALLGRMEFGRDGYFFVYDLKGRNLMHPRQPELVGRDLSGMRDGQGRLVLASLLQAAQRRGEQGAPVRYLWQKPSAQRETEKLGYVVAVPQWGWMLGTGFYRDDIDLALRDIDHAAADNIRTMLIWVAVIFVACTILISGAGLALNISDHRQADAALRQLARRVVNSQEQERARLSRELHDGVSQHLVSIKLLLESAQVRLAQAGTSEAAQAAQRVMVGALEQIQATVAEVRRISHNLRPALLDDLGLPTALTQLCAELTQAAAATAHPLQATLHVKGDPVQLTQDQNTALFRIAQEAVTNTVRHAQAHTLDVHLTYTPDRLQLTIADNGQGFDESSVRDDPQRGIGLRNMRERLHALGGSLHVQSSARGTRLVCVLPLAPQSF